MRVNMYVCLYARACVCVCVCVAVAVADPMMERHAHESQRRLILAIREQQKMLRVDDKPNTDGGDHEKEHEAHTCRGSAHAL